MFALLMQVRSIPESFELADPFWPDTAKMVLGKIGPPDRFCPPEKAVKVGPILSIKNGPTQAKAVLVVLV